MRKHLRREPKIPADETQRVASMSTSSLLFSLVPILVCIGFLFTLGWMGIMMFVTFRQSKTSLAERIMRQARQENQDSMADGRSCGERTGYNCSHCGAGLDSGTEISPSGDFKCAYCQNWSNVN